MRRVVEWSASSDRKLSLLLPCHRWRMIPVVEWSARAGASPRPYPTTKWLAQPYIVRAWACPRPGSCDAPSRIGYGRGLAPALVCGGSRPVTRPAVYCTGVGLPPPWFVVLIEKTKNTLLENPQKST